MTVRTALALCALMVTPGIALPAQADVHEQRTDWQLAPFVGIARHSPVSDTWGVSADRNLFLVGVHLQTSVLRVGPLQIVYAPSVTPLLRLTHTPPPSSGESAEPAALGWGITPLGLGARVRITRSVSAFGVAALGATWFNRQVPVVGAREFNVAIEWGGGLDIARAAGGAVQVGYKFVHLSNAYSAAENPGVDGHLFFAGWRWSVDAHR